MILDVQLNNLFYASWKSEGRNHPCSELRFSPGESRLRGVDNRAGWSLGSVWMKSQLLSVRNLHLPLLCLNIRMDISAKLGEEGEGRRWRRRKKDTIWVESKHRYHFWCETIKNDTTCVLKQVFTCKEGRGRATWKDALDLEILEEFCILRASET